MKTGVLAAKLAGKNLPLQVLSSRTGYYIGTMKGLFLVSPLNIFNRIRLHLMLLNWATGHNANISEEKILWPQEA